jgi:S1-C subfamily serine protease
VHTQLARGHLFELGNIKVRDPLLYLSVQKAGALASTGGRLGAGLLSRFDVTFDASRSRIILEKNANFGRPDTYDRLGMWLSQAGQNFAVADVIAGGPADMAGVRPGDTILEIDGASTASLVLPVVREQLERRSAGDRVKLLLQSGDRRRVVVIRLQDRV